MKDLFGQETGILRAAEISECGIYCYSLTRHWFDIPGEKTVCFVMLNPSKADANIDDPTIRRCIGYARSWKFSALKVVNLFALRSTDPSELLGHPDPVGPCNDLELSRVNDEDMVVAAWGTVTLGRDKRVMELLAGKKIYCLELTKEGYPRHPLYCRADLKPQVFRMPMG